jgi:hypothetical protein
VAGNTTQDPEGSGKKPCLNCSSLQVLDTPRCKDCGQRYPTAYGTLPSEAPGGEEDKPSPAQSVVGGLMLVLLLGLLYMNYCGDSGTSEPRATHSDAAATVMCQSFVRDRLAAPSTARFPRGTAQVTKADATTYRVASHVDAQNHFGAQIRSRYVCTVRWVGDGNWRLISLEM